MTRAVAVALVLLAAKAGAQAPDIPADKAAAAKQRATYTNLSVPEIPAFSFLGATPTDIARPNGARSVGAALLQGMDQNGKVKQGFALEVLPLLQLGTTTLKDYQNSLWARIRTNLQLSIGTARASGDSSSTDLGLGLRATLLDRGDPLADRGFVAQVDALTDACAPDITDTNVAEKTKQCMEAKVRAAADEWNAGHWNASAWIVAAALGTQLEESKIAERRALGWRAWTTYGVGLSSWGLLLLHAAYDDNRVAGPDSSYKAVSGGIRILVGGSRLNGFAELTHQQRWDTSVPLVKSPAAWSGGVEFPAGKDFWISAGMGKAYKKVDAPDRVYVFANIKWGVSGKSRLDPR